MTDTLHSADDTVPATIDKHPCDREADEHVNEVRLVGRLGADPVEKALPSGDVIWLFRVTVQRPAGAVVSKQRQDTLDCAVWRGRVKRSVAGWAAGDLVEVGGAVRKRFYQAGGRLGSRVEVEVVRGRIIRRAGTG